MQVDVLMTVQPAGRLKNWLTSTSGI